jgi:hypothetical protein
MIFSFHVGLTASVMQRMQLFFLSVSVPHCQIYYFNIRKKVNKRFIKCVKIIVISAKAKVKIANIILLRQKISIKRCYF